MPNSPFHLIVGDGVVGQEVAAELGRRGIAWKLGSRQAEGGEGRVQVDAGDTESLVAASRGASHIYITLGLQYNAKIWEQQWPQIMKSVVEAAKMNGVKIVYFDNIYAYGPPLLQNPITEEHPVGATSRKGKVRQAIAEELMAADKAGTVKAIIARAADYYGPGAKNSGLYVMAASRMIAGKAPQLLSNPEFLHSYTYTLDAGRGLVELALDESAYGQVWHLPTATPTLTDAQILAKLSKLTGAPAKPMVMPKAMIAILGLFVPILRELREMLYQTDSDYVFSSAKFEARYPKFKITSYDEGLKAMVESFRK